MFLIAAVVFVLVEVGVLYLVWRYRKRKDDDDSLPAAGPRQHQARARAGPSSPPSSSPASASPPCSPCSTSRTDPADAQQVKVIGQQWWWEYRYDVDGDGEDDIVTANDLVIPAGEPVNLTITSRDVIHSFWIPALNGKKDAVPGRDHPLTIEADEPGVYRGQCTEFCGLSHAFMRMRVVALSPEDYADWEERQLEGAEEPDAASWPWRAWSSFRTTCSQCHLVSGEGGNEQYREEADFEGAALVAGAAPNLTHFASRGVFAGGVFDLWMRPRRQRRDRHRRDRARSSTSPPSRPGCATHPPRSRWTPTGSAGMPNLNLTEEQIDALVAYLETLE